ncbi:MAG: PAS domain S-box-containing protein [Motiliproteus sp.]|jgi:PAS domain S-box-containing protein
MKHTLIFLWLSLQSSWVLAGISTLFKDEEGQTNWQHLANWTSAASIILLTILSMYLFIARRRAYRANRDLDAIRRELEDRVQERTATLDQSNKLLLNSNQLLEKEVAQHVITTDQLRSSESYIKDILISMPLILVGLDKEGRVTQWNKKVEELSGIKAEQALGKTLWEAYPTMTVVPEHIKQALDTHQAIHLKQNLSGLSYFDITIYPLQDQEEPGVVILVDDVSKQTAAENMLIHNDKMSFMGELASTMAHDINAPLQAIMIDLKRFQIMLTDSNIHPDTQLVDDKRMLRMDAVIRDMSLKGEKVSSIISNLLAFARSRKDAKQQASIVDVMNNTIRLANDVITVSNGMPFNTISLKREFARNLPLLSCHITELQQVFLSLFRHACYSCHAAMEDPERAGYRPRITVTLSESYGNLWIKIQHNGVGLNAEQQVSLFEPFFSDQPRVEDFDAGNHLSFSYYIITQQHQGHMAVTSEVASGSTIHMQLPIEH